MKLKFQPYSPDFDSRSAEVSEGSVAGRTASVGEKLFGEEENPAQEAPLDETDETDEAGETDETDAMAPVDGVSDEEEFTVIPDFPEDSPFENVIVLGEPDDIDAAARYESDGQVDDGNADAFSSSNDGSSLGLDGGRGFELPPINKKNLGKHSEDGRKSDKAFLLACGVLLALVAVVYGAGAAFFASHMYPQSTVGDSDVSLMTTNEVENTLEGKARNYGLEVTGDDFEMTLKGTDIGFVFDGRAVAKDIRAEINPFAWPAEVFKKHDYSDIVAATFDEGIVKEIVSSKVAEHNETASDPVDAHVGYSETSGKMEVIPEHRGTKVDENVCYASVKRAIRSVARQLTLVNDDYIQPKVFKDNDVLKHTASQCNDITQAHLTIMMRDVVAAEVGIMNVLDWVDIDDKGNVALNMEKRNVWLDDFCNSCNTLGGERTYTRSDGKEVTVSGGSYGWEIDTAELRSAIEQGLNNNDVNTINATVISEAQVFNGLGKRDWGDCYVDVDLSEQYVRYYDNSGAIIWESDCISGKPYGDTATPTGVYVVNRKSSPETLNVWEGGKKDHETVVQYWMPFVDNLIGLHDADWQPGFGGTMYRDGYGSHGCVNLPPYAAQELYGILEVGTVVVVHW